MAPTSDKPAAGPSADEYNALVQQNAALRQQLEQARGADPAAAERAGLEAAAANTPRSVKGPDGKDIKIPEGVFLSEGVRSDLERLGRAIDPYSGKRLGDWSSVDAAAANSSTGPERGFTAQG